MTGIFFDNLFEWMLFNLFLAFIPLLLSLVIFNKGLWEGNLFVKPFLIVITGIFFLFLPNAPYVLTDIIHLVRQIKEYRYFKISDTYIITILIPQFIVFIFIGFSCYVISVQKFLRFLKECGAKRQNIMGVKVFLPFFMSIGVFLGRVHRYSSWDIITHISSIFKILVMEMSNLSFYIYIAYFYIIIVVGFESFSLLFKSILKDLFEPV